jgi:uncharacterized protein YgbK (DUF1537 family)
MILILNVVEKGSCFRFTTQQLDSLLARQAHHEITLGHDTPQAVTLITDKIQKATENYVRGYF